MHLGDTCHCIQIVILSIIFRKETSREGAKGPVGG